MAGETDDGTGQLAAAACRRGTQHRTQPTRRRCRHSLVDAVGLPSSSADGRGGGRGGVGGSWRGHHGSWRVARRGGEGGGWRARSSVAAAPPPLVRPHGRARRGRPTGGALSLGVACGRLDALVGVRGAGGDHGRCRPAPIATCDPACCRLAPETVNVEVAGGSGAGAHHSNKQKKKNGNARPSRATAAVCRGHIGSSRQPRLPRLTATVRGRRGRAARRRHRVTAAPPPPSLLPPLWATACRSVNDPPVNSRVSARYKGAPRRSHRQTGGADEWAGAAGPAARRGGGRRTAATAEPGAAAAAGRRHRSARAHGPRRGGVRPPLPRSSASVHRQRGLLRGGDGGQSQDARTRGVAVPGASVSVRFFLLDGPPHTPHAPDARAAGDGGGRRRPHTGHGPAPGHAAARRRPPMAAAAPYGSGHLPGGAWCEGGGGGERGERTSEAAPTDAARAGGRRGRIADALPTASPPPALPIPCPAHRPPAVRRLPRHRRGSARAARRHNRRRRRWPRGRGGVNEQATTPLPGSPRQPLCAGEGGGSGGAPRASRSTPTATAAAAAPVGHPARHATAAAAAARTRHAQRVGRCGHARPLPPPAPPNATPPPPPHPFPPPSPPP